MSLFSSEKIFTTHEQLRAALYHLGTLDQKQLDVVYAALIKEFDDNGLTAQEIKDVVRRLRNEGLISEIDKEKIIKLTRKN